MFSFKPNYGVTQVKHVFILVILFILFGLGCGPKENHSNHQEHFPSIDSLIDNANKYSANYYSNNSKKYIDSATAGKTFSTKEKIRLLSYRAYLYNNYIENYDSAQLYVDSMTLLLKQKDIDDYKVEFAHTYFANGDVHFRKKQYTEAYGYYYKARKLSDRYFDSCTMGDYSHRIGMILYQQARYEPAKENFVRAFNELAVCDADFSKYFRRQECLNNAALSFYKMDKLDSAYFFYQQAIAFINKHKNKFPDKIMLNDGALGVIYGNLGDVLLKQNKPDAAKAMYRQSVTINFRQGYEVRDAQLSYLKLANLFFQENNTDSLNTALILIRQSLDNYAHDNAEIRWNKLMWQYCDKKQEIANAYKYLSAYLQKTETYQRANKSINELDIKSQFDFFEKQEQLHDLQNEYELNQLYLAITLIIVALVLSIAFFLWYGKRKSQTNIAILQGLNKTINSQNEQLEIALKKLEENSKDKDRIVKMVAHDLRTPVASIMSLADLVEEEKNETAQKEMLHIIKQACTNALNLISEILQAARKEITESEKEKIVANLFIDECVSLLQIKATEKQHKLLVNLPTQQVYISINKEKFSRVINNLVTNSVKFSHIGSAITISLTVNQTTNKAIIAITDKGIGIPNNLKDKVFDMLTEAKRYGTNGEQPFGLGLSICKQIVEAHKGKIWFESEVNQGTTFFIELPIVA